MDIAYKESITLLFDDSELHKAKTRSASKMKSKYAISNVDMKVIS